MRVIVAERHDLPLLAAQVVVRSGAEVDPPDLAGTASMIGDFLTRGTEAMSAPEIARTIESLRRCDRFRRGLGCVGGERRHDVG